MQSIYYIYGDEPFLVDEAVQKLIREAEKESHNETEILYLETDNVKPQVWAADLEFSPLFQLRRMIIMRGPAFLNAENKRIKDEKIIKDIFEGYLSALPEGQTLVLVAKTKPATNPIVKILGKTPKYVECQALNPAAKEKWLNEQIAALGCQPESKMLVNRLANSGQDLYYLSQLLHKMALLSPDHILKMELLNDQVEVRQEVKIFKLIDAIFDRQAAAVIEALHALKQQGDSEIQLLFMVSKQFALYAEIRSLFEDGKSAKEIESLTSQKPYTVKKMIGAIRRFSWEETERNLRLLLEAEVALKSTSKDSWILLEVLLTEMTAGTAKAEKPRMPW